MITKDNWIPCYQRLPANRQLCLITVYHNLDDGYSVGKGRFYEAEDGNIAVFDDGFHEYVVQDDVETNNSVVAWMPMPEPYSIPEIKSPAFLK